MTRGDPHRHVGLGCAHWNGVLYPEGLPAERRLDYYISHFATAELNASYCKWPDDRAFAHRRLPAGFVLTAMGATRPSLPTGED